MRLFMRCLLGFVCVPIPAAVISAEPLHRAKPLHGAQLPASFSLGRYVPGDYWMYMHFAKNPDRAWIEQKWAKVWDALEQSGIDGDILGLVTSVAGDEERPDVKKAVNKAKELCAGVHWGDLIKREFVVAERIAAPRPDYLLMARGAQGSGEANAAGLAAIFKQLALLSSDVEISTLTRQKVTIWTMARGRGAPYIVHLFRKSDTIGLLITSPGKLGEILSLMDGTGDRSSIIDEPRFKAALRKVQPPEGGVMFFDYKLLLEGMDSLLGLACAQACSGDTHCRWQAPISKALSMCDFADYGIVTIETEGHRDLTHSLTRLRKGKADSPIARLFLDRKPFDPFDRYIPADAIGFSMSGLIDLGALYHIALDFVRSVVPNGAGYVEKWNAFLAPTGFDPDRDLFDWWSGEMISIDMPPTVVTPMGGTDSVLMVRVKNPALAAEKIGAALKWAAEKFGKATGQTLLITPALDGLAGFHQVTWAPMAMFMRPVVGVEDEWLMIATSAGAVKRCLDVAAGKAPSIMQNEHFLAEGLIPKGPVRCASFKDTSKFGQEMGQALGMASMIGGMMGMGMAGGTHDDPEERKAQQVIQKVFGILTKLSPVVAKIDFFSSESTLSTTNGLDWRSERVVTYKGSIGDGKTARACPVPR